MPSSHYSQAEKMMQLAREMPSASNDLENGENRIRLTSQIRKLKTALHNYELAYKNKAFQFQNLSIEETQKLIKDRIDRCCFSLMQSYAELIALHTKQETIIHYSERVLEYTNVRMNYLGPRDIELLPYTSFVNDRFLFEHKKIISDLTHNENLLSDVYAHAKKLVDAYEVLPKEGYALDRQDKEKYQSFMQEYETKYVHSEPDLSRKRKQDSMDESTNKRSKISSEVAEETASKSNKDTLRESDATTSLDQPAVAEMEVNHRFGLMQKSNHTPNFSSPQQNKASSYDPKNKQDIQKLQKMAGTSYKYDSELNQQTTKIKLTLQPVAVLGGELGVFAAENIESHIDQLIGYYQGERRKFEAERNLSKYDFQFINDKDEVLSVTSGESVTDWVEFLNQNLNPNIRAIKATPALNQYTFQITDQKGTKELDESQIKNWDEFFTKHLKTDVRAVSPMRSASRFVFQIINKSGEIIEEIDANNLRDWTSFVNHSFNPNLRAAQLHDKKSDKYNIGFFTALEKIKKDQQFLYNYGEHYFFNVMVDSEFNPYFIHTSDGALTPMQLFVEHRKKGLYANGTYIFDEESRRDLQLCDAEWLLPNTFLAILNNDLDTLEKELQLQQSNNEVLAYACDEKEILDFNSQQHLTPLMYACYLGRKDCIKKLLSHGADVDRCMLNAGLSPLVLLLISPYADPALVEELSIDWLTKGKKEKIQIRYPFTLDRNQLSLLHYAILRNSPAIVGKLLQISETEKEDIFASLLNPNRPKSLPIPAAFDYCIEQGQFGVFEVMYKKALSSKVLLSMGLANAFHNGLIIKDDTLEKTSLNNLVLLSDLLKKFLKGKNKKKQISKEILLKIDRFILKKQQQEENSRFNEAGKALYTIAKNKKQEYETISQRIAEGETYLIITKRNYRDICNDFNRALDHYRNMLTLDPDNADVKFDIAYMNASIFALQADKEKSLTYYMEALTLKPNNWEILSEIGNLFYQHRQVIDALYFHMKALQENPTDQQILEKIIICLIEDKKYNDAQKYLDQFKASKERIEHYRKIILEMLNKHDEVLVLHDPNSQSRHNAGNFLKKAEAHYDNKNYIDALEMASMALSRNPYNRTALYVKAQSFHQLEKFELAVQYADYILNIKNDSVGALAVKGQALYKLRKYELGKSCFEKILQLEPDNASAKLYRVRADTLLKITRSKTMNLFSTETAPDSTHHKNLRRKARELKP